MIADLSGSGPLVFVFGDGLSTAHLKGMATPLFRGPADRHWWHVEVGDETASWTMIVRVDEVTGVRFVREPYPFPSFPGREVLTVQFLGHGGESVPYCYVQDLYDGQRMRPEKLAGVARAVREPRRVQGRSGHSAGPGCLNGQATGSRWLTATVTATAAASGYHRQAAASHHACTFLCELGLRQA